MALEQTIERIKDYFFGTDITEHYRKQAEKHPERRRELRKERNKYLLVGKAIPNVISLSGAITAYYHPIAGMMSIAIGEGTRSGMKEEFLYQKREHIKNDICRKLDETIDILSRMNR
ncbi:hypothetical protein JXA12_03825 [Candidatus Woesearchaeota archaeon]|nr:hypothetical protein [Candidatus Woesearchaeota archaeon]